MCAAQRPRAPSPGTGRRLRATPRPRRLTPLRVAPVVPMTEPHRPFGSGRLTAQLLGAALLGAALVSGLALAGCQGGPGGPPGMGAGQGGKEAEERPTPVLLATVERGTIQGQIRAASTIEAELQVTVHAESTGRITTLELNEGDAIKSGQVLARIKRDAQSLGFERAETNLADVDRELERVKKLYEQGIVSQSEYDAAKTKV